MADYKYIDSARMGVYTSRVRDSLINFYIKYSGTSLPTMSNTYVLGDRFYNTSNKTIYICTSTGGNKAWTADKFTAYQKIYYYNVGGTDVKNNKLFVWTGTTDGLQEIKLSLAENSTNLGGVVSTSYVTLTGNQALTGKTYEGYTLNAACAKEVEDSILVGEDPARMANLPTIGAVVNFTDEFFSAKGHTHRFDSLTSKPTTLSGYGITDAASSSHNHSGVYEPVFDKNTAFNKDFGDEADTVCEGNDVRLSDARTPVAHEHPFSEITGTATNTQLPDELRDKTYNGYTLGDACAKAVENSIYVGEDLSRLANLPTVGAVLGYIEERLEHKVNVSSIGVANGVAGLDAGGKVPSNQLPSYVDDVVELLTFNTTNPSSATNGDQYYNTSSKTVKTYTVSGGTGSWRNGTTPEKGKIYIRIDTASSYRWGGSDMVLISNPGTVTSVAVGDGLITNITNSGPIITTGTISLDESGVTIGTYKKVTVDKYGRVTAGSDTVDFSELEGTATNTQLPDELRDKTYNGYTLGDACAKAVENSIYVGEDPARMYNLPTVGAVINYTTGQFSLSGHTHDNRYFITTTGTVGVVTLGGNTLTPMTNDEINAMFA